MRLIATAFITLFLFNACEKIDFGQEQSQTSESGDNKTADASDTLACTLYNSHVVAFSDALSPDSVELTLVSLLEWDSLPSANNTANPNAAADIADTYVEGNLPDWHIPTSDEAKRLQELYGTTPSAYDSIAPISYIDPSGFTITVTADMGGVNLYHLNLLLQAQGGTPLLLTADGTNVRYLCEAATRSFSLVTGTVISKAGTKQSTYHLRLLKTIHVPAR